MKNVLREFIPATSSTSTPDYRLAFFSPRCISEAIVTRRSLLAVHERFWGKLARHQSLQLSQEQDELMLDESLGVWHAAKPCKRLQA
eukprot:4797871-Amphidinium_carterae.1